MNSKRHISNVETEHQRKTKNWEKILKIETFSIKKVSVEEETENQIKTKNLD